MLRRMPQAWAGVCHGQLSQTPSVIDKYKPTDFKFTP